MKKKVKHDLAKLFRLWGSRLSNSEVAIAMGFSVSTLKVLARKHHLPNRRIIERDRARTPDPTPEEILERAAAVRRLWSVDDRIERRFGGRRGSSRAFHMYDSDSRLDADPPGLENV